MARVTLTQISSRAWEHPADRAALNTLRSIPGFDEVVRKVAGFFGERGVRQLFLAIAVILINFGLNNLPFLAGIAILPFQLALLEWSRKSEFSCDRAGLLATQDINVVMSAEMNMAGGGAGSDTLSVDEFIKQAEAYE